MLASTRAAGAAPSDIGAAPPGARLWRCRVAEILIQRRRHRNVWPWLLGLLALALLPLPFMAADRGGRSEVRRPATRRAAPARQDTTARADSGAAPTEGAAAAAAPGSRPRGGVS